MPIAGKGMLITSMDVPVEHEAEFNLWYDREHLAERVAIPGFVEARRWLAEQASPKYFCTYSTEHFATLSSPAYENALANQTAWSRANMARFANMIRAVGRITVSRGQGRGGVLAVVRLRPPASGASGFGTISSGSEGKPSLPDDADSTHETLRESLCELMDPGLLPAIISMHLVESDPAFSRSLTDPQAPNPGAADWFVLIEGTDLAAVADLAEQRFSAQQFADAGVARVSVGTYRLMWDLARSDL